MRPTPAARTVSPVRFAALLILGALVLHGLRYLIDPAAGSTRWAGDHAYLTAATPMLVLAALGIAAASLLAPLLGRGRGGSAMGARTGPFALALLALHLSQEATEGLLAGSSAAELLVSLLAGAAFAIPLALALGAAGSLLAGWLEGAERRVVAALAPALRVGSDPRGIAFRLHLARPSGRIEVARPHVRGPPAAAGARS